MAIYRAVFPAWEREAVAMLAAHVESGRYLLAVGLDGRRVVGFYVLSLNPALGYVLFAYLAVAAPRQGAGLGTALCRDAMARFRRDFPTCWLLIEAEARQAVFYGRLGFYKLVFDYAVPRFDGPGSVAMSLMAWAGPPIPAAIEGRRLEKIVRHIFIEGYRLPTQDPRIAGQLARIPASVALIPWPRADNRSAREHGSSA